MKNDLIIQHMQAIEDRMKQGGLRVSIRRSLARVEEGLEDVGKDSIHPISQVSKAEMEQGRAFWLFTEREGNCVSCISARRANLKGEDFESYFRSHAQSKYRNRKNVVADVSPPLNADLKGRLIYFGGIQVAANERGGIRQLGDFAQYAKLLAASLWDFDWMYTIIAYKHRRLADDYGFTGKYRNAITWNDPIPEGLSNDQMFLGLNSTHFGHILKTVEPGQL